MNNLALCARSVQFATRGPGFAWARRHMQLSTAAAEGDPLIRESPGRKPAYVGERARALNVSRGAPGRSAEHDAGSMLQQYASWMHGFIAS